MAAPENSTPPVGEEIHLPGNSALPVLLALGITISLVGVTFEPVVLVLGLVLTVVVIALWIRDARRELMELPLDHHHS